MSSVEETVGIPTRLYACPRCRAWGREAPELELAVVAGRVRLLLLGTDYTLPDGSHAVVHAEPFELHLEVRACEFLPPGGAWVSYKTQVELLLGGLRQIVPGATEPADVLDVDVERVGYWCPECEEDDIMIYWHETYGLDDWVRALEEQT